MLVPIGLWRRGHPPTLKDLLPGDGPRFHHPLPKRASSGDACNDHNLYKGKIKKAVHSSWAAFFPMTLLRAMAPG